MRGPRFGPGSPRRPPFSISGGSPTSSSVITVTRTVVVNGSVLASTPVPAVLARHHAAAALSSSSRTPTPCWSARSAFRPGDHRRSGRASGADREHGRRGRVARRPSACTRATSSSNAKGLASSRRRPVGASTGRRPCRWRSASHPGERPTDQGRARSVAVHAGQSRSRTTKSYLVTSHLVALSRRTPRHGHALWPQTRANRVAEVRSSSTTSTRTADLRFSLPASARREV